MDDDPLPIVDGCYVDQRGDMYKVKMVELQSGLPTRILMEDLFGQLHRLSLQQWRSKPMTPCCMTRSQLHPRTSNVPMPAAQPTRPA